MRMLNTGKVKKIKKEINKRLKQHYRESAYCYFDSVTFHLEECEGIFDLHVCAGYIKPTPEDVKKEVPEYEQVHFTLSASVAEFKSVGEIAVTIYLKAIEYLDDTSYFELER